MQSSLYQGRAVKGIMAIHLFLKVISPKYAVADSPVLSESDMIAIPEIIGGSFTKGFFIARNIDFLAGHPNTVVVKYDIVHRPKSFVQGDGMFIARPFTYPLHTLAGTSGFRNNSVRCTG